MQYPATYPFFWIDALCSHFTSMHIKQPALAWRFGDGALGYATFGNVYGPGRFSQDAYLEEKPISSGCTRSLFRARQFTVSPTMQPLQTRVDVPVLACAATWCGHITWSYSPLRRRFNSLTGVLE